MNLDTKLFDYLESKIPNFQRAVKSGITTFTCPNLKNHRFLCKEPTCTVINGSDKCQCLICSWRGNIYDIIRLIEEDKKNFTDAQVTEYLINSLQVDIYKELDTYQKYNWALVPIAKNGKAPIEKNWTEIEHREKVDWIQWLNGGINLGARTGKVNNITVIDIDNKPLDNLTDEQKKIRTELIDSLIKLDTLTQNTTGGGKHIVIQYEESLPQTVNIADLKIDIRNDGGQIVVSPSLINKSLYCWVDINKEIKKLPEELLSKLLELNKVEVGIKEEPVSEKIEGTTELQLKNNNLDGCCNDTFVKIGGILINKLTPEQTEFVLHIMNINLLASPMPTKAIKGMLNSLEGYKVTELMTQEKQIYECLKILKCDITAKNVVDHTGLKSNIVNKYLAKIENEGILVRIGRGVYNFKDKIEWIHSNNEDIPIYPYKIPFFNHIANFHQGDILLLGGKSGRGKCLAKGTGIIMADGTIKKVEDIVKNDEVMGVDSQSKLVIDIGTGKETMYEIIPIKGESFKVNESHILSLKSTTRNKHPKGNIINISVKDFLETNVTFQRTHKLYRVPLEFKNKQILLDPYFLGLWLGDGDKSNSRITSMDKEIIDYLGGYAKELGLKLSIYKYPNRYGSYAITTGKNRKQYLSTNIRNILKIENLLYNKHIPFNYKTNSRENRLKLLAGLIDSDGYAHYGNYGITIVNETLAKDIVYLCRSLGFLSYMKSKKTSIKKIGYIGKAYRITIIGNCSEIPVKINRKKVSKRKINKDPLVTGFSIKKCKEEQYYGFTLDGDHLYLIDSFIVNHNTHIAVNVIKEMVIQGVKPYYFSFESGSRYKTIANTLGLKSTDFYVPKENISNPLHVSLEENACTLIDWIYLGDDFSATPKIFNHLKDEMKKAGGILFVFTQLQQNYDWYAKNMIQDFISLSAKHRLDDEYSGKTSTLEVDKIRDPKGDYLTYNIPCEYDAQTKIFKAKDVL